MNLKQQKTQPEKNRNTATWNVKCCEIDNLVQIGHNCKIGKCCLIAGCCGISGSVTIGDGVTIAGHVSIKDHISIGDRVTIGGKSGVINDIPSGETVLGFPAINAKKTLRKWALLNKMIENIAIR